MRWLKRIFWISSGVSAIQRPPRVRMIHEFRKKDSYLSMYFWLSSRPEERSAHAHVGCALFDGDREVVAHAHGEPAGEARPLGTGAQLVAQLPQTAEPGAG